MRAGLVTKLILHRCIYLAVEQPQRNICRAGIFAQAAVNASPPHMYCPDKVKNGDFGRNFACGDQFRMLKTAFLAKTDRTDIATTVTF